MSHLKKFLLLSAAVFISGGFHPKESFADVSDLIAKVDWVNPYGNILGPRPYGTAILYSLSNKQALYLVNYHVLPTDHSIWSSLMLVTNSTVLNAEVLGAAPGYDLAVLRVQTSSSWPGQLAPQLNQEITMLFLKSNSDEGAEHIGILGFPHSEAGLGSVTRIKSTLWPDEARGSDSEVQEPKVWNSNASAFSQLSSTAVSRKISGICPPLFLKACYLVPIRTWGYSGDALLAADHESINDQDLRIIGIISDFSPLNPMTYAIPIEAAVGAAKAIEDSAKKHRHLVELDQDEQHLFTYLSPQSIRIESGPLKGFTASSPTDWVPGGGESMGGGGESMGGGGESMGGGNNPASFSFASATEDSPDLNRDYWLPLSGAKPDFDAPLDWLKSQQSLVRQALLLSPVFQGMSALLTFRPGVKFQHGPDFTIAQSGSGRDIAYLQSFLKDCRTDCSLARTLSTQPIPVVLPQQVIADPALPGLHSEVTLSYQVSQFEDLVGNIRPDVQTYHFDGRSERIGGLYSASLSTATGEISINATDSKNGKVKIQFLAPLVQTGADFLQYAGPVVFNGQSASALAFVEKSVEDPSYEFKVIVTPQPVLTAGNETTPAGYPPAVSVHGFYLKMQEAGTVSQ